MIKIRLLFPLVFEEIKIPAGTIIAVPFRTAKNLISKGVAKYAEPERAIIEAPEKRTRN